MLEWTPTPQRTGTVLSLSLSFDARKATYLVDNDAPEQDKHVLEDLGPTPELQVVQSSWAWVKYI